MNVESLKLTSFAPYEKSKSLGSGGSMVSRLKLKGIDGRAPPGVNRKYLLLKVRTTSVRASQYHSDGAGKTIELRGNLEILADRTNRGSISLSNTQELNGESKLQCMAGWAGETQTIKPFLSRMHCID